MAPEQLGPRVVVFCHFDAHGRIHDHTRAYLDALHAEGFDLVFVTNSSCLAPLDLAWIRPRAISIVSRRNLGYDFAAWRDAMAVCKLPNADTRFLLLANDSVYGPLCPLRPMLDRIDFAVADVWSATDSWQHRFHLQSFFVAFGPKALHHEAFSRFWRSVGNVRSKWWVVRKHEIGMSRYFIKEGLRCHALWPYSRVIDALRQTVAAEDEQTVLPADNTSLSVKSRQRHFLEPSAEALRRNTGRVLAAAQKHIPLNPTADLWKVLIDQGCPFIKRELLRTNPSRVPDVAAWSALVGALDPNGRDIIMRDLALSLKNRSP